MLEGALERSVALAAAMDARGYGRTAQVPAAVRRTTTALTLGGLLGVCAGTYGLLAAEGAGYGLPVAAGRTGSRAGRTAGWAASGAARTRYRPDRWGARAWLVSASGAAVAALMIVGDRRRFPEPLQPPGRTAHRARLLPLWPAAAVLLGLLPARRRPGTGTLPGVGTGIGTGTGPGTGTSPGTDTGTRIRR